MLLVFLSKIHTRIFYPLTISKLYFIKCLLEAMLVKLPDKHEGQHNSLQMAGADVQAVA